LTRDPGEILMQAVQLHQGGQLGAASGLYEDVLRIVPDQPDALHLLGVLALQSGRPADAVALIRRAINGRPENAVYYGNLGVALQATGQCVDARAALEQGIELDPGFIDALFNLGVTLQTLGLPAEAAVRYQQVLALMPHHAGAGRNLGNALHALGRHGEAIEAYRVVLTLAPADAGLLGSMGTSLAALGQHDEAIEAFEGAVRLAPGDADAWLNLAMACHHASRFDRSIEAYQRALAQRPDHVEGWQSFGRVLSASDRIDGAIDSHKRALALVDGSTGRPLASTELRLSVMRDLVSALFLGGRRVEASEILRTVVTLDPSDAESWRHLGVTLAMTGAMDEAAEMLERAIDLDPTNADYLLKYVFVLDTLETTSLERAYEVRRTFNERHARPLMPPSPLHTNSRKPERRLRVGYVSGDFRQHSASSAFLTILEHHDPRVVEVVCYSNSAQSDHITERFKACASLWRTVDQLTDEELAAQIRADRIDVLMDLSGYSGGNRLLTFARKPAPVQVTAWGYCTGTGLDAIDAYFSDPVIVPPEDERFYSEKVVHLPNVLSYTVPPVLPPIPPLPVLEKGTITFGSYNRAVKITATVLDTWARIMHAVPGSRLLLKPTVEDAPATRERLLGPLVRNGIDLDRIEILGKNPHYEHIASFGKIDFQIDTFPHGGGITTLEGLLMGVPCVTLLGDRVAGRTSASFVTALGLGDLVTRTTDEYVDVAVRLANDLGRLTHERATLRDRLLASPIGDARKYTQAVEVAYRELWRAWCGGRVASGELRVASGSRGDGRATRDAGSGNKHKWVGAKGKSASARGARR
jgi:predicted O-linked N-acetylglucosamine transferase (SPINDLY family)